MKILEKFGITKNGFFVPYIVLGKATSRICALNCHSGEMEIFNTTELKKHLELNGGFRSNGKPDLVDLEYFATHSVNKIIWKMQFKQLPRDFFSCIIAGYINEYSTSNSRKAKDIKALRVCEATCYFTDKDDNYNVTGVEFEYYLGNRKRKGFYALYSNKALRKNAPIYFGEDTLEKQYEDGYGNYCIVEKTYIRL